MSRGKAFLFWTVIELRLFSCAFYLSLWKRAQVHRLNAWVIRGAPFPAHFSAPGNKSHLSLVSEVEKLTVPSERNPLLFLLYYLGLTTLWKVCCCVSVLAPAAGLYPSVHSWAFCYAPKRTCSSLLHFGLHGTCHVSGKILITLARLRVLGAPDDSSLLREDSPTNLKGGFYAAKGAAIIPTSA